MFKTLIEGAQADILGSEKAGSRSIQRHNNISY